MTIFTTTGNAFNFAVAFFFALTRTGISFLFRRMCWWCWCFSQTKKAHVLVPQERTYLSLKNDGGNLKHVRVGVSRGVFLRIFRHVSDVKKWCKSWLPFSGLMWSRLLLNMQHLPLRLENCHGPVWPIQHGNSRRNGSWLKRSNFFWGEVFFDGNSPLSKTWICEKLVIFFTDSKPWDSSPWDSSQLDGGFMFFFNFHPYLGGRYNPVLTSIFFFTLGWSWNHQLVTTSLGKKVVDGRWTDFVPFPPLTKSKFKRSQICWQKTWHWGNFDRIFDHAKGHLRCVVFWRLVVSDVFFNVHPENWGRWTHFWLILFQMGWFNHHLGCFWKNLAHVLFASSFCHKSSKVMKVKLNQAVARKDSYFVFYWEWQYPNYKT